MRPSYDVVIAGGAMTGSAVAFFLSDCAGFGGSVLVVERDPTLEFAATSRSGSSIRQQFSNELNIRMSQFGARHIRRFREETGGDPEAPEIRLDDFGYLVLATEAGAGALRESVAAQNACGAPTRLLTPDEIAAAFPDVNPEGAALGAHNPLDEGWFEGDGMHPWWRKVAKRRGVEFVHDEVVGFELAPGRVAAARLASGASVGCGWFVNATGARGARVAALAGLSLPVEPRKRYSWMVTPGRAPVCRMPLLADISGVWAIPRGPRFHVGMSAEPDDAAEPDDFAMDPTLFEERLWPALAHRAPLFETLKVTAEWACHYDYNTLDQNAIVGPAPGLPNFLFANGFSGHGLQQAPAVGRALAELVAFGAYRSLDLGPLGAARIGEGRPFLEKAII